MTTNKYWKTREIKAREKLLDTSIFRTEKELRKMYKQLAEDILTQVDSTIFKMMEGKSLSHFFNYKDYYELLTKIQKRLKDLGDNEVKLISKDMTELYKNTSDIVSNSNKFKSIQISEANIKRVINGTWVGDGKNWSDRIWTHQGELSQKLAKGILDTMEAGIPLAQAKKDLMKSFNVGYSQASRIVRTEFVHSANEATIDRYKEAGVQKYLFICAQDERTCEECLSRDGKEFSV